MRAVMTNDVCDHVEATASAPDDEGWVAAEIPIESLPRARGEPPRLGPEIVVESPPELRAAMIDAVCGLRALDDVWSDAGTEADQEVGHGRPLSSTDRRARI